MARVIYKFGGTSVGDTRRLYRAARRIAAAHRAGDEVVAVLSAQAGATDALLARGREIDPDCAGREADSLLSTGEQVSVSLCALALARLGVPAVSLCGWQMGLQTDGSHGSACGNAETHALHNVHALLIHGIKPPDPDCGF